MIVKHSFVACLAAVALFSFLAPPSILLRFFLLAETVVMEIDEQNVGSIA